MPAILLFLAVGSGLATALTGINFYKKKKANPAFKFTDYFKWKRKPK